MLAYFTYLPQSAPMDGFPPNFCTAVEVVDVITYQRFVIDRLRDVDFVWGHWLLLLTSPVAINAAPYDCTARDLCVDYTTVWSGIYTYMG